MAGKKKASKFEGMTEDQILAKAKALEDKFRNTPARKRPQDFYDFGNKAVEINRARRAAREKARMSKEDAFDTGLATTWAVPKGMEQTRNRLAALFMQESGPRADAAPDYTLLGAKLVASAARNYMDKFGLTAPELISGKGKGKIKYGGPGYLTSIADIQEHPELSVYDWANDKFKRDMFVNDDTTFNHMTNAVQLASDLVNGTLRPITTATNFKHLAPDDEFDGMTKVDYDFGETPVPTNKVLKLYVDPNLKRKTRQDAKGGDAAGAETDISETPVSDAPVQQAGPRIVINPTTFRNSTDAMCVAFNEGFRVWMEVNDFQPQSEPTDAQRKFFSDTAYADDELQLRRTILARIATFDTSVKDPTDDQLAETGSFLDAILESDWCKNDWERNAVSRLSQAVKASVGAEPVEPRPEPVEPREPEPLQSRAAMGGGETEDENKENPGQQAAVLETMPDNTTPGGPAEPQEPVNPGQPAGVPPQDAQGAAQEPAGAQGSVQPGNEQGAAQEPAGAQGDVQPGNEQAQPQDASQGQENPPKRNPQGTRSGVWSGGEPGKGRELTEREAEWMRNRIQSGASVSNQSLSMFGLQRNERGSIVDSSGNAFNGFGGEEKKPLPGSPDAKLDDRDRKRRKA